jgi:hypothetical protein
MGIGIRLRKLWSLKAGVVVSLGLSVVVAMWSIDKVTLFPPGIAPRQLEMASAVTHLVVDTPSSAMIDLREDTYSLTGLQDRAVVLGNVMANDPVESEIAARAHVPPELLRIQAPLTPQQASPVANSQGARHVSDILKSNGQYRIDIEANPTVPMLDIYAQTPTAASAAALANAAAAELKAYLAQLAVSQGTPLKDQIRLDQLGRATGTVINPSVKWQTAILAFVLTLGVSCASVIFFSRVRAGWHAAAMAERAAIEA